VRPGPAFPDGEGSVEQQDALVNPARQIAMVRRRNTEIGVKLRINVGQASRQRANVTAGRKGPAHRVTRCWVGVLTENHDPNRFERHTKCAKDFGTRGCVPNPTARLVIKSIFNVRQRCGDTIENGPPTRVNAGEEVGSHGLVVICAVDDIGEFDRGQIGLFATIR